MIEPSISALADSNNLEVFPKKGTESEDNGEPKVDPKPKNGSKKSGEILTEIGIQQVDFGISEARHSKIHAKLRNAEQALQMSGDIALTLNPEAAAPVIEELCISLGKLGEGATRYHVANLLRTVKMQVAVKKVLL